jgi:hypothetical protein
MSIFADELDELEIEVQAKDQEDRTPLRWTGEELVTVSE